ncbi:MAG TPA: hypothetical protein VE218_00325, partial [Acidobacteriaceae bacterium]|nr:hypothetical protein [Acidobacteriaceae bacterium]
MDMTSRRTFLKLAAMAAPSARSFGSYVPWGRMPDTPSGKAIQAWRTSETSRCEQVEAPVWRTGAAGAAAIQLDPDQGYQEVLGFGAALTDSSCYLLGQ